MVPHPPLIIPDVGGGEEKKIQKTIDAYKRASDLIGRLQPETIVLLSPHQIMYADYFHISPGKGGRGDFGQFRAGQTAMEVSYDTEFVRALCEAAAAASLPAGRTGEKTGSWHYGALIFCESVLDGIPLGKSRSVGSSADGALPAGTVYQGSGAVSWTEYGCDCQRRLVP